MTRGEQFEACAPMLFAIAYRMLGSVSDAEDAVQEAWLRFDASPAVPTSAKAFLAATVTHIAMDVLRSARVRREVYVGPWFPDPLLTDPYEDPERAAELADSLSMAALVLLERLSPLQRAVFVLREVFGFSFGEIAAFVGRSEAACRQLAARARRHLGAGLPRFPADAHKQAELARQFFAAFRAGDVDGLRAFLAADARLVGDSGAHAPRWRPIAGADRVARVMAWLQAACGRLGVVMEEHPLNGQPSAVFWDQSGRVLTTWSLDVVDTRVQMIRAVLNPEKLAHLGPVGHLGDMLREAHSALGHF